MESRAFGSRLGHPPASFRLLAAALLAALCSCPSVAVAAQSADPLARARRLYNEGQFDAAISAADESRLLVGRAASADLVAARAYLERFRQSGEPLDLASARERLRQIDATRLGGQERDEFLIGLGEVLFFDGSPGAAADLFDSILVGHDQRDTEARERVLDWWASAADAEARPRPDIERQAIYQGIRDRMHGELGVNPGSASASYWLSAAARAQGDLQAAWEAAEAGWVRAPLTSDHGVALRSDLDRLVQIAIAPERARALGQSPDALLGEWQHFKEKWQHPE